MKDRPQLTRALLVFVLGAVIVLTGAVAPASGTSARAPLPGYLTAAANGKPSALAVTYLRDHAARHGLTAGDLREVSVTSTYTDAHNGVTHVYLQQRYRGIDVHNGIVTANVTRDGAILSVATRFVPRLAQAAGGHKAARTAVDAVRSAARHLDIDGSTALKVLDRRGGAANEVVHLRRRRLGPRDPGEARVAAASRTGSVRLAWNIEIARAPRHLWSVTCRRGHRPDARHGRPRLPRRRGRSGGAIARPGSKGAAAAVSSLTTPNPVADGSSYRVFELPKESPTDGDRTLVSNPADADASPFGWHDTNGAAGAEFTTHAGQQRPRLRRPRRTTTCPTRAATRTAAPGSTSTSRST